MHNLSLIGLINELDQAKDAEREANEHRLALEKLILTHPEMEGKIKPEGTSTFKEIGLSVTTGFTRTRDQKTLKDLALEIKPEFFPFAPQYKEDRKISKAMEQQFPELWQKLSTALTLKPKKPTVTIKG